MTYMNWPRRIVVVILLSGMAVLPAAYLNAQLAPATLGGLLLALGQLRQNLDAAANTVDAEAAARIRQLELAIDGVIKEIDRVMKEGFDRAQTTEQKLYSDVADVLERTNHELEDKGYLAYLGANSTLVNVSRTLEGLPFVKTRPYVFAVSPLRLDSDATDRRIAFYGHFPDVSTTRPATVDVVVSGVPGVTMPLETYLGNQQSFVLPARYLTEGRFVELTVHIPTTKLWIFHGSADVHGRVYVATRRPFTFSIQPQKSNPALWATLPSPSELHERADSGRTSNNQTISAQDAFARLVNDNTTYDMSTASFAAMTYRVQAGGKPCDCCDASSAALTRWDAGSVAFSLYAPTCGDHWCNAFYHCGGGGTNADIWLTPTFRIKRRNTPETVPLQPVALGIGHRAVSQEVTLAADWAIVEVMGTFKDGAERYSRASSVSPNVPIASTELWTVQVQGNRLRVTTR